MQIFYAPDINADNDTYLLDENESKHMVRVMRMKENTPVKLIDGKGNLYEGIIMKADSKRCLIKLCSIINNFDKRDYKVHIAISPLKNPDRFEWFVEKTVEIGIDEITPLICKNTEKTTVKSERIQNIIVAAMKQSLKATKTILHEPCTFNDFIIEPHKGRLMIAHCMNNEQRFNIDSIYSRNEDCTILIGPEGDFSDDEIQAATQRGFAPIHLGNSRLRTETAGIAACLSVYYINQIQSAGR